MADAPLDILDLADKLFTGELPIESHHPFASSGQLAEVQSGVAFVDAFANSAVVDTGDGLVAVDTSGVFHAKAVHETVRRWSPHRLNTAIFTHGHIDHVFGVDLYEEEARTNGWQPPHVLAHTGVADRFDRYQLTAGYNAVINQRQFRLPSLTWPVEYRYPDETYTDLLILNVADETFELFHDRGETDDATWVWSPRRRIVFAGDMFIWASPNCGNPQKVQRYPRDWAAAYRKMAALGARDPAARPRAADRRRRSGAAGARRERRAPRDAGVADAGADERRGAARRHRAHACTRPRICSNVRTYARSTTSPSSSSATSGGCTAAGTTATRPTSSRPSRAVLAAELASLAGGAERLADRARRDRGGRRPTARRSSRRAGRAGRSRRPGSAPRCAPRCSARVRGKRRRPCRRACSDGPSTSRARSPGE